MKLVFERNMKVWDMGRKKLVNNTLTQNNLHIQEF